MRRSKFNTVIFILLVLCAAAAVGYAVLGYYGNRDGNLAARTEYTSSQSGSTEGSDAENSDRGSYIQNAFYVLPSDICADNPDQTQVRLRCASIVQSAVKLGFDSVVLDTYRESKNDFIYKSDYVGYCGVDVLSEMLETAGEYGINVFPVYYVNSPVIPEDLGFEEMWKYKTKAFEDFIGYYSSAAGFVLTDYYAEKTPWAYYMFHKESGSESVDEYFTEFFTRKLSELLSVCKTKAAGLIADSYWGGDSQYPDGYIDSAGIVKNGYADFIIADIAGLKSKKASKLYSSWTNAADSGGFDVTALLNAADAHSDDGGFSSQQSGGDTGYASVAYKNYETLIDQAEKSGGASSEQDF